MSDVRATIAPHHHAYSASYACPPKIMGDVGGRHRDHETVDVGRELSFLR